VTCRIRDDNGKKLRKKFKRCIKGGMVVKILILGTGLLEIKCAGGGGGSNGGGFVAIGAVLAEYD
jgi:hypothetical protein